MRSRTGCCALNIRTRNPEKYGCAADEEEIRNLLPQRVAAGRENRKEPSVVMRRQKMKEKGDWS